MTSCPSFEPAAGSTCTQEDQVCGYEHCAPPDYNDRHMLTCINGAWTITDVSACPVQPCPATPPVLGSVCYENVAPERCIFANACGADLEVACVEGTWQAVGAEDSDGPGEDPALPAPMCPAYPPYLGDPCCPTTVPEICDYSATATGTDGAAGASFLIQPGSTSGGAEPPITLTCARCTPEMTWSYCSPK